MSLPLDGEVRRALVRRFPYAILYLADAESVAIVAVFHTSSGEREFDNLSSQN